MSTPSGENTIAILLAAIKQYDVRDNPDPSALFLAEDRGFSIYCTQQKTPAKFIERQAENRDNIAFRDQAHFFVGRCYWLWSHDQHDVIGVRLRTDITPSESNITWGYADKRMAEQNRPHDITWANEKIEWLWRTALPSAPPRIVIEDKINIHEYIDWADFS